MSLNEFLPKWASPRYCILKRSIRSEPLLGARSCSSWTVEVRDPAFRFVKTATRKEPAIMEVEILLIDLLRGSSWQTIDS